MPSRGLGTEAGAHHWGGGAGSREGQGRCWVGMEGGGEENLWSRSSCSPSSFSPGCRFRGGSVSFLEGFQLQPLRACFCPQGGIWNIPPLPKRCLNSCRCFWHSKAPVSPKVAPAGLWQYQEPLNCRRIGRITPGLPSTPCLPLLAPSTFPTSH